ncbi:hypothetical protein NIES2100_21230 [Calothrix sp. NIES-2100]|uniref:hypothetical protein n=1 Tax=Calothrix sp. NIES-2100 TaxID=1954172 RepID=UPI000B60D24D|nr:hypothetical protein NIES2100_21230 [Calothrix sp. NIES-2100]
MRQLDLFDLSAIAPPPPPAIYDPAWDDKVDTQIASNGFDNSRTSPECPSSQENFSDTVLEQVTPDTEQSSNLDFSVLEQAKSVTRQSAPEQCHWVEKYTVTRHGKEHYYYRYLWMSGRKLHHVHIPGGNSQSAIAKNRKSEVESAIADGQTPGEIQILIKSWSN